MEKPKDVFESAALILKKYPLVLLMAAIAALSMAVFAHHNYNDNANFFILIKIALVASLGISLTFALKMYTERHPNKNFLRLLAVPFLIFFYFLLPEKEQDFNERYAFLLLPSFLLSHLLASFIPFLRKDSELKFWQYNKNLFINLFLTGIFTAVLTGGIELAVLAVNELFDFNFSDRLFAKIFYLFAIFGSCFIFLLFNVKGLKFLESDDDYPQILKFFTQYILIPLLLIYVVILYFYSAKILLNWELPRGWVSYLILAYSIVGIFAFLLVYPLKSDSSKSWVKLFSKIFFYSLSPLLILLFTAVFTRILEYGYTEARYFVLLLALWLTSIVGYFILWPKNSIKFIPTSLFIFGLFSLVFPYLNVFSASVRSQKNELSKLLQEENLLNNQEINFSKKVGSNVADEIADKMSYLMDRKENDFVYQLLDFSQAQKIQKSIAKNPWNAENEFRDLFQNVERKNDKTFLQRLELVSQTKVANIQGFQYMISHATVTGEETYMLGDRSLRITSKSGTNPKLDVTIENEGSWDVVHDLQVFLKTYKDRKGRNDVPEISLQKKIGNRELKIMFNEVVLQDVNQQNIFFNNITILVKSNEEA